MKENKTIQEKTMLDYPPNLAAIKKIDNVPDGFLFYEFEWLGTLPKNFTVMKVTGATFREAKSGPRKGQRCIKVKNTKITVYITSEEINNEKNTDKKM